MFVVDAVVVRSIFGSCIVSIRISAQCRFDPYYKVENAYMRNHYLLRQNVSIYIYIHLIKSYSHDGDVEKRGRKYKSTHFTKKKSNWIHCARLVRHVVRLLLISTVFFSAIYTYSFISFLFFLGSCFQLLRYVLLHVKNMYSCVHTHTLYFWFHNHIHIYLPCIKCYSIDFPHGSTCSLAHGE